MIFRSIPTVSSQSSNQTTPGSNEKQLALPSPDMDLTLSDYSRLLCAILDIPVHVQPKLDMKSKQQAKPQPLSASRAHIEALHVMFTLYSEFKNSQHFGRGGGAAAVGPGGGMKEQGVEVLKL